MYFSFVSTSTRPSYAVTISLITKLYGKMAMITDSCVEWFLADVTLRRATIRLPLLFRQRHGHVSRYQIFHSMRQVLKLLPEPCEPIVIATI